MHVTYHICHQRSLWYRSLLRRGICEILAEQIQRLLQEWRQRKAESSPGAEDTRARSGEARSNHQVSGDDHPDVCQNYLSHLGEFQARYDMPDEANSVIQLMIEDSEAE
jgi:hypothetical protein